MIIEIDEVQRIRGTDTCWQLERLRTIQAGKNKGGTKWVPEKYHSTLGCALSEALQREIRTHPAHTITEAIKAAERLCAKYAAIFDRVHRFERAD